MSFDTTPPLPVREPPPVAPEPENEPEPDTPPPLAVGDIVVDYRRPGPKLIVIEMRRVKRSWMAKLAVMHRDDDGYMIATANDFVPAPAAYRDPPSAPLGAVMAGPSVADWEAKLQADAADPAYQAKYADWCREMIAWAHEHAMRVNPKAAAAAIDTHALLLADHL